MIDSYLRYPYQKWVLQPLLKNSIICKLHPLLSTGLGLFSGLLVIPFLALHHKTAACLVLLLSGFFDTLDGTLARMQKKAHPLGAVCDILSDRLIEFSVVLGLYLFSPQGRALPCILMLGSILFCITSFLVVGIFIENTSEKSFHYSPGLMERTEAFCFFALMILIPKSFFWLSIGFSLLVFFTGFMRFYQFYQREKTC